ncbi:hypothetical protein TNCV_402201 [Trichonephila clavipes]|nr:hypothetical protein TNCV_402201 [Trichonephila clavipes]
MTAAIADPPNKDAKDGKEVTSRIDLKIDLFRKELPFLTWSSLCKSFREGQQTISDILVNIHPHVCCETKAALKISLGNVRTTTLESLYGFLTP